MSEGHQAPGKKPEMEETLRNFNPTLHFTNADTRQFAQGPKPPRSSVGNGAQIPCQDVSSE